LVLGNGHAAQGDERIPGSTALGVDARGQKLLPGPGLFEQEDRGLGGQVLGPADELLDRSEDEAGDEQADQAADQGYQQGEEPAGPRLGWGIGQQIWPPRI
jgi:hypothetical protein